MRLLSQKKAEDKAMLAKQNQYSIDIKHEAKIVEITFQGSSVKFDQVAHALDQLREYIANDYCIKLRGYWNRKCNSLKAFMFALGLFGHSDRIILESKSKYSKAERRKMREQAGKMRREGYTVKQISDQLNVPLKTVYRWLKASK